MASTKPQKAVTPKPENSVVEIVFDFSKLDLFEMLDLIEISAQAAANQKEGKPASEPANTVKIMQSLKKCFVSSSRPLTGSDYVNFIAVFWNNLGSSNPN
jgi:hypothetical protein